MQNHRAADAEGSHGAQGEQLGKLRTEGETIREERRQSQQNAQNVQPHRRAYRGSIPRFMKAELQQNGGGSNRCYHHDRQRTEKSRPIGERHNQRKHTA